MADQIVQFEGAEHHFPADFTDADIKKALQTASNSPPAPPQDWRQLMASPAFIKGQSAPFVGAAKALGNAAYGTVTTGGGPIMQAAGALSGTNRKVEALTAPNGVGEKTGNVIANAAILAPMGGSAVEAAPILAERGMTALRGAREGIAAEAPQIKKWGKVGAGVGAVLGHGGIQSLIGEGGAGYVAGAGVRAIPAAVRGARAALKPFPELGEVHYASFTRPSEPPPPDGGSPASPSATAPSPAPAQQAVIKSLGYGNKSYDKLTPVQQAGVDVIMRKMGAPALPAPAPAGGTELPAAPASSTASAPPAPSPNVGSKLEPVFTEGETEEMRNTRLDKEEFLVNYLRARGIDKAKFDAASLTQKNKWIGETNAYRNSITNPTEVAAEPSRVSRQAREGKTLDLSNYNPWASGTQTAADSIKRISNSPLWNAPKQWLSLPAPQPAAQ